MTVLCSDLHVPLRGLHGLGIAATVGMVFLNQPPEFGFQLVQALAVLKKVFHDRVSPFLY